VSGRDLNWWVYCLQCDDGSYYIGISTDVVRRYQAHRLGRGARYTRGRRPVRLVGVRGPFTRGEALREEVRQKRRSHEAKARFWERGGGGNGEEGESGGAG